MKAFKRTLAVMLAVALATPVVSMVTGCRASGEIDAVANMF